MCCVSLTRGTLPTPKQKAALIGRNQANDEEKKNAWLAAGESMVDSYRYLGPGGIQSGLTMTKRLGAVSVILPVGYFLS